MSRAKARREYTKDFKSEAVALCRQPGMSVARVAADLGVPANSLYRWNQELAESGADAFRGSGKRTAADPELYRLQRENAELKMYVNFFENATVFFARNER